ncbi:MAG: potassium-transporting ATPase subunit A [Planctomycetaceae bacterium]|nr:potassium-transporting ATPase subunit A [Planctomycetaceae bacterium]
MWTLPILIVGVTILLSIPLGLYMAGVLDGRRRAPGLLRSVEDRIDTGPQDWKQYAGSMLLWNVITFVIAFLVMQFQAYLPLNPDNKGTLSPTTVFNTLCSFLSNTNLQHYSGEVHLSYFSQLVVICWKQFHTPAIGLACLVAVIRGLRGDTHMGNFYVDLWRSTVYVLLPVSTIVAVLLIVGGMPMTLEGNAKIATVEAGAMGTDESGAAKPQEIARGPVAAIVAIKQLGTNGGGFFGPNSTHPYENPNSWTNFLECVCIILIPMACVVMFGRMLSNMRHAAIVFGVMLIFLSTFIAWGVYFDSMHPNPALTAHSATSYDVPDASAPDGKRVVALPELAGLPVDQELGNLEGKELRFGTSAGPTWAAMTTCTSNGSVNAMHDSLNPLAGLTPLSGMWLNCNFGGVGVGLINMLIYLIVAVFLAGLMVGRTPEYLGKKVEGREMKLAMLALLIHPLMVLGPTGLFTALEWGAKSTNNPGPHGFSEILYEFTSASANNGSGFEGLADGYGFADNPSAPPYGAHWDIACGLVMLLSRFVPIIAPLAFAGSLAAKKRTPFTVGTLRTDTLTFGFILLGTIVLVGALLVLPAAVLGPIAEHLGPLPFGG